MEVDKKFPNGRLQTVFLALIDHSKRGGGEKSIARVHLFLKESTGLIKMAFDYSDWRVAACVDRGSVSKKSREPLHVSNRVNLIRTVSKGYYRRG